MKNPKEIVEKARKLETSDGYQMIFVDVVSLFTNVPLKQTIHIILRMVYDEKLIKTKMLRKKMEKLSMYTRSTIHVQFIHIDGVMMGSLLGALSPTYSCANWKTSMFLSWALSFYIGQGI